MGYYCTNCMKEVGVKYVTQSNIVGGYKVDLPGPVDPIIFARRTEQITVCANCGKQVFYDAPETAEAERTRLQKHSRALAMRSAHPARYQIWEWLYYLTLGKIYVASIVITFAGLCALSSRASESPDAPVFLLFAVLSPILGALLALILLGVSKLTQTFLWSLRIDETRKGPSER